MSTIYSFLQKRKMHESNHGFFMIVVAYVLSFVMLVLGSDTFYNINSMAAGVNKITDEDTQVNQEQEYSLPGWVNLRPQALQAKLINPYGISDFISSTEETQLNAVASADTVWLLGHAMDTEEYNSLLEQMKHTDTFANVSKTSKAESKKLSTTSNKTSAGKDKTAETMAVTEGKADYIIDVTKDEITMLERIVEAEATGEDMVGRILIANVVFNRMKSGEFPDTVKGVIFQKVDGDYQFSPVEDERYWSVKISKKTKEAVVRALQGEDYSKGALYFVSRKRTSKSSAKWFDKNLDWLFKHGGHEFYKNK
jgi:N-acetylmuramoyl-L-alanine amidase